MKQLKPLVSIVVPVRNEENNVNLLYQEIERSLSGVSWELIWVDDASTDGTWKAISSMSKQNVRGFSLKRRVGQSAAIWLGITRSQGDLVVTMDGDLQSDPGDIPRLISLLTEELDLVQGYRINRKDSNYRRVLPSKIANFLSRLILKIPLVDAGCTLRVFRRSVATNVPIIGDMHRLLGHYLIQNGARYIQTPVNHRKRLHGKSKYGLSRTWKFPLDVILFSVIQSLFSKPLYLFAKLAATASFFGVAISTLAIILRITDVKEFIDGTLVISGIVLCCTSVLLIGLGFLAEMLARQNASASLETLVPVREELRG